MAHRLGPPRRPLRGGVTMDWDPGEAGWWRLYHGDYYTQNPRLGRRFGPLDARFDHHRPDAAGRPQDDPDGRSVIYLGQTRMISAAEVLWDQPPEPGDDPDGPRIARVCRRYRFAQLRPTAPVKLLRLDGTNADAIGAFPELASGPSDEYPLTQEWARAVYEDLDEVHGIYYPNSHDGGLCIALWDKAPKLQVVRDGGKPRDASIHDPGVWDRIVVDYTINNRTLVKVEPFRCFTCRRLGLR